jgi:hypothetical protein
LFGVWEAIGCAAVGIVLQLQQGPDRFLASFDGANAPHIPNPKSKFQSHISVIDRPFTDMTHMYIMAIYYVLFM